MNPDTCTGENPNGTAYYPSHDDVSRAPRLGARSASLASRVAEVPSNRRADYDGLATSPAHKGHRPPAAKDARNCRRMVGEKGERRPEKTSDRVFGDKSRRGQQQLARRLRPRPSTLTGREGEFGGRLRQRDAHSLCRRWQPRTGCRHVTKVKTVAQRERHCTQGQHAPPCRTRRRWLVPMAAGSATFGNADHIGITVSSMSLGEFSSRRIPAQKSVIVFSNREFLPPPPRRLAGHRAEAGPHGAFPVTGEVHGCCHRKEREREREGGWRHGIPSGGYDGRFCGKGLIASHVLHMSSRG
ncbi:hypothetical protein MKZ38_009717 [Zalerion maritima]|uniref:Uncharacterized protein n=1 Tax=Zalerion maritima TaxID=339359 RepID=A0AAD5RT41_9PEZI|nr:hypothetical protein MKZ38_009717 [Zalerion maritima]